MSDLREPVTGRRAGNSDSCLLLRSTPAVWLLLSRRRDWRDGRFALLTREEQLEEFRRVARYPRVRRYIEPAAAGTMHNELRRLAVLVTDLPGVDTSRDPADNFPLAVTQAGEDDFLVTGDQHDLLSLGMFGRTRIITARRLPEKLGLKKKRRPIGRKKGLTAGEDARQARIGTAQLRLLSCQRLLRIREEPLLPIGFS